MKITLCGSIAFYPEMLEMTRTLASLGHKVKLPMNEIADKDGNMISIEQYYEIRKSGSSDTEWIWDRKEQAIRIHFEKIEWSDAVLILNYAKNDIPGYIGGNTLVEMGLALHLRKPIYLLNEIPELSYKEEILAMKPRVINGDFGKII